jgi:hypothetical protein
MGTVIGGPVRPEQEAGVQKIKGVVVNRLSKANRASKRSPAPKPEPRITAGELVDGASAAATVATGADELYQYIKGNTKRSPEPINADMVIDGISAASGIASAAEGLYGDIRGSTKRSPGKKDILSTTSKTLKGPIGK